MKQRKELAFVGLGEMGQALAGRLVKTGYTVHGYDRDRDVRKRAARFGVRVHDSLAECLEVYKPPHVVWLMVPADSVDDAIKEVRALLKKGACIIDGGNSFFKESVFRHHDLDGHGIDFIDCGVMGGVRGARDGASLTVGGDAKVIKKHEYIFQALAEPDGYGYVGGPGAGHFVKMVHNGIEYGMMGAIAEGINTLHEHKDGMHLNIQEAIKAYEHGSIIEGTLISWLADTYKRKAKLQEKAAMVEEDEKEMDLDYLIDHTHERVLSAALTQRKLTRVEPSFIGTLIRAIRNQFGEQFADKKQVRSKKTAR